MTVSLQRSTRFGPYDIVERLGAGGMGEVYRARDTRLNRDVAIKVLPELFASDADRLARFVREAQVLAALNHPNIAQIHGLEEHAAGGSGMHALVMELVEGEDLARRLRRGAVPVEEALQIARQVAEGLEAAHEQGIVHRDLKPANIQLRADGTVKLLDFGIAKALESPDAPRGDAMNTPTVTSPRSALGLIVGTAAYMAPEQAAGRAVDRRTDIWAFGAVLYEMLTGKLAFPGEHATESIAAVLRGEPKWDALPASTPPRVRTLLRRCLTRDPKQRLQAIGDARIEIVDVLAGYGAKETAPRTARSYGLPVALGVVLVGAGVVAALMLGGRRDAPPSLRRFSILLPVGDVLSPERYGNALAVAPDGGTVVFVARRAGVSQLFRRSLDEMKPVPIGGTTDANSPGFSPDGAWLAFGANGKLRKVRADGTGDPIDICDAPQVAGVFWTAGDAILFGGGPEGIRSVRAAGGTPESITKPGKDDFWHAVPELLPGGRHVLFHIDRGSKDLIAAVSLADGSVTEIVEGRAARYSPTGHLVYMKPDGLWAAPFDAASLRLAGEAVKLQDRPRRELAGAVAHYAFGPGAMLAYLPESLPPLRRPFWAAANQEPEPIPIEPRWYSDISLSPSADLLAFSVGGPDRRGVWVRDLARRTLVPISIGTSEAGSTPVWSRDGKRLAFSRWEVNRYNVFVRASDGTGEAERVTDRMAAVLAQFWTPDGNGIVVMDIPFETARQNADLVLVSLKDKSTTPLLNTAAAELNAVLSPDGGYMAYQSNESGRWEVYVRPFPNVAAARWPVSPEQAEDPRWSADGRTIFYRSHGRIMRVAVDTKAGFSAGPPQPVVDTQLPVTGTTLVDYVYRNRNYDVTPDGSRVVVLLDDPISARDSAPREIVVVTNWPAQLPQR